MRYKNESEFQKVNVFGKGQDNVNFAQYFTGVSFLNPLTEFGKSPVFPANVKHWHGAKKDSWFSHISVEVPGEETSNEWCDPVTDEEYDGLE